VVPEAYDELGNLKDQAEAYQQVMLGLYDLRVEARDAQFPETLIADLERVRLSFMDEFEEKYPGFGKGRATWR
jgi:hypothetical protein